MNAAIRDRVHALTNTDLEKKKEPLDPFKALRNKRKQSPYNSIAKKAKVALNVDDDVMIGLKRGESSFTIDPLHKDWDKEQHVPREDGREWPEGFEGEGGYYEGKWRTEEEQRREILESHPDYQFLTLVAGFTNTVVEQLYEEGDISALIRRQQALLRQQRIALEEVKATTKGVVQDVESLTSELENLKSQRKRFRILLVEVDRLIGSLSGKSESYEESQLNLDQLKRKKEILSQYSKTSRTDRSMKTIKTVLRIASNRELKLAQTRVTGPESEDEPSLIEKIDVLVTAVKKGSNEDDIMETIKTALVLIEKGDPDKNTITGIIQYVIDLLKASDTEDPLIVQLEQLSTTLDDPSTIEIFKRVNEAIEKRKEELIPDMHLELAKALIDFWLFSDDIEEYTKFRIASEGNPKNEIRDKYVSATVITDGPLDQALAEEISSKTDVELQFIKSFYDVVFFLDRNTILAIDPRDLSQFIPLPQTVAEIRAGTPPQIRTIPMGFDKETFKNLYRKLGGTLFKKENDPDIDIVDFYTSEFREIFEEILQKSNTDAGLQKRLIGDTFVREMKVFRESLPKIRDLNETINQIEEQLFASRERLSKIRRGEVTFKDIEQPYRHRRQWVNAPEHSGIVRIKPIVVSGIDAAFKLVQRWIPYGKDVDVEFLEHDSEIRGDFAKLVAIEMSFNIMRFPKQYLQIALRKFSKQDQYDTIDRLKTGYTVTLHKIKGVLEYKAETRAMGDQTLDILLQDRRDVIIFN